MLPDHSPAAVIGWDVGGAHVKAARVEGGHVTGVVQLPCPLWLGLEQLPGVLAEAQRRLESQLGPASLHAATMTGELADAFPTRAEGVARLADALVRATAPAKLRLYGGRAGFLDPATAAAHADSIASANWHATAALAGRCVPDALLVDMGSTTTDLIPIGAGRPAGAGYTDAERMACGELVFTGLVRTPVMALCRHAPFAGAWTPFANELFATAADAYRLLGELPDGADQMATADGREKTMDASRARLARMVGRDAGDASPEAWRTLAAWLAEAQLRQVMDAASLVLSRAAAIQMKPDPISSPVMPGAGRASTTSDAGGEVVDARAKPGHDNGIDEYHGARRLLPHSAPVLGAGVGRHIAKRLAIRLGRPYRDFAELPPLASVTGAAECAPAVAVALLACPA